MKQPANRLKLAANVGLLFGMTAAALDLMAKVTQAFATDCIGDCLPHPNLTLPFAFALIGLLVSLAVGFRAISQRGSAKLIALIGVAVSVVSLVTTMLLARG
jgi:hypothetical protein